MDVLDLISALRYSTPLHLAQSRPAIHSFPPQLCGSMENEGPKLCKLVIQICTWCIFACFVSFPVFPVSQTKISPWPRVWWQSLAPWFWEFMLSICGWLGGEWGRLLMGNPAPVKMENLSCLLGFHLPQPVQDFFHQPMCNVFLCWSKMSQPTDKLFVPYRSDEFFSQYWIHVWICRCFTVFFVPFVSASNFWKPSKTAVGGLIWWPVLSNPSS